VDQRGPVSQSGKGEEGELANHRRYELGKKRPKRHYNEGSRTEIQKTEARREIRQVGGEL